MAKKKRKYGFETSLDAWTTKQKLWLITQVEGRTQKEIFNSLTAEHDETRPDDVERWEGTFGAFKKRLQRLTRDGIDPAIDIDTGKRMSFDLGTARGRYDYWIWLAKTATDKGTRLQALTQIEKLAPQFEEPELGPDKIMVANPKKITLNAELISELILTMRHDLGGIDKVIPFDVLEIHELEHLQKVIDRALLLKIDGQNETEIIPDGDDDE